MGRTHVCLCDSRSAKMPDTITSRSRFVDSRDDAYVRAWFVDLEILARIHGWDIVDLARAIDERRAPEPTYILADGTRMVPADYFALLGTPVDFGSLRERFDKRLIDAAGTEGVSVEERVKLG